jgi:hypothetical protein
MGMEKKNSIDGLAHNFVFMGNEEGCKIVGDMIRKLRAEHYRDMYGGNKKIHQGGKGRIKSSF